MTSNSHFTKLRTTVQCSMHTAPEELESTGCTVQNLDTDEHGRKLNPELAWNQPLLGLPSWSLKYSHTKKTVTPKKFTCFERGTGQMEIQGSCQCCQFVPNSGTAWGFSSGISATFLRFLTQNHFLLNNFTSNQKRRKVTRCNSNDADGNQNWLWGVQRFWTYF